MGGDESCWMGRMGYKLCRMMDLGVWLVVGMRGQEGGVGFGGFGRLSKGFSWSVVDDGEF